MENNTKQNSNGYTCNAGCGYHCGKHSTMHTILKVVLFALIFMCGFKLGMITGFIGHEYGRGGMMGWSEHQSYGDRAYGPGMMNTFYKTTAVPATDTTLPAKK